jgi:hypothetical protein
VLLSLAAALYVTGAHSARLSRRLRFGDTWMGAVPHFHPGGWTARLPAA